MHLNHFLMVDAPNDVVITQLKKTFELYQALDESAKSGWEPFELAENEEIERVSQLMKIHAELPPIERATMMLAHFEEEVEVDEIPSDFFQEVSQTTINAEDADISEHRMNIFVGLRMTEYLKPLKVPEDPAYRAAILNRKSVRDQIEYVQRLCGKTGRQSTTIAMELVGDMDRGRIIRQRRWIRLCWLNILQASCVKL